MQLEQRMKKCLAAMYLLSSGGTQSIDSDRISNSKASGGNRPGDGWSLFDEHLELWKGARTEAGRREVVENAEKDLENWRVAKGNRQTQDTLAWKRMIANSDLGATELHRLWGISRQYVYELRRKYGKTPA